jgi:phytoene desaturase
MERQGVSLMTRKTNKVIVIGGGLGGLTTAALIASSGIQVTLIEKNSTLGGKLQDISLGNYRFDFGPSTITMPWIFERIFEKCGKPLDPSLSFVKLNINTRNHFSDGSIIDLSADPERMNEQLQYFSAKDRSGFQHFLQETGRIQQIAEEHFFRRPFSHWDHYLSPALAKAFLSVRPFESMDSFHRQFFQDSRLVTMMNRYATYVGSDPLLTPATLSMIAYVELIRGVYYIPGGNYRLVEAFHRLAVDMGVEIITNSKVAKILTSNRRVTGVELDSGDRLDADAVVSNVDVIATSTMLGRELRQQDRKLSISGFLTLAGVNRRYPQLEHHNLFFPENYKMEFTDLFERRIWPNDPTVYVCFSGKSESERAAHGSNLYVLTNVPPLDDADLSEPHRLTERSEMYREKILGKLLEQKFGLSGLRDALETAESFTPLDIMKNTGSVRGALYGNVSHGMRATFFRHSVKDRALRGMYYTGGTVHPGGGTPMVVMSGTFAAYATLRDFGQPTGSLII